MVSNFDIEIDRRGTNSNKWSKIALGDDPTERVDTDACFGEERIIPMWVADMDFRTAPPVVEALKKRVEHGIFGYTSAGDSFTGAVVNWIERRHGWRIQPEWITVTPGVVPAIYNMVQCFTRPGEKVLIQPPVYHPFYKAIEKNDRIVARNRLLYKDGYYTMDFADLEKKAQDPAVTMAVLCNPHNPVGRVWRPDELRQFAEICLKNDVLVVADELHSDLILRGHRFTALATLSPEYEQKVITCMAPSKTFNLAGLKTSAIIIPDEEKRQQFATQLERNSIYGVNPFGVTALEAAYNEGEPWLEQLLDYVTDNFHFMARYIAEHIPQIKVVPLEGTYLAWLDCRGLGLDTVELQHLMVHGARVSFDEGCIFGPEGNGFERINIACPRHILAEALHRICMAVERDLGQRAGVVGAANG
jgi:cystathionine beta-lyase